MRLIIRPARSHQSRYHRDGSVGRVNPIRADTKKQAISR